MDIPSLGTCLILNRVIGKIYKPMQAFPHG
jgi:hypothetical protein